MERMISVIVLDPCADRGSEKSGAACDLSVSETAAEVNWNFSVSKSMLLAALDVGGSTGSNCQGLACSGAASDAAGDGEGLEHG
jgi:hypothetical protein